MANIDYSKILIKYSSKFNQIKNNELYPITGFYIVFLDDETEKTSSLSDVDVDSYNTGNKIETILNGSTYGRSVLRVAPCIRIQDKYQFNLVITDTTISSYNYIMLLFIDNTEISTKEPISNFVNLNKKYYKYLRLAAMLDGAKKLILQNSNFFTLTGINCDLKKIVPYERDFLEHLEQYNVDKRNADDSSISPDQFVNKTSGLDLLAEKTMDPTRQYNCPRLNSSGRIEY